MTDDPAVPRDPAADSPVPESASAEKAVLVTVPAETLFWTIVPAVEAERLGAAVRFRFEAEVPVPLERVQVIEGRLKSGVVVVVGIDRTVLLSRIAGAPLAQAVIPASLPPFVQQAGATDADRERWNFLVGDFEPPQQRQRRRQGGMVLLAACLLMVTGVLWGIERRVSNGWAEVEAVERAGTVALDAAFPAHERGALRPELRLVQELRRLDADAAAYGLHPAPTRMLDVFLRALPQRPLVRINEVTADAQGIRIQGAAATAAEAQEFHRALTRVEVDADALQAGTPLITPGDGSAQAAVTWRWSGAQP